MVAMAAATRDAEVATVTRVARRAAGSFAAEGPPVWHSTPPAWVSCACHIGSMERCTPNDSDGRQVAGA